MMCFFRLDTPAAAIAVSPLRTDRKSLIPIAVLSKEPTCIERQAGTMGILSINDVISGATFACPLLGLNENR
jgi:hypothetical protein